MSKPEQPESAQAQKEKSMTERIWIWVAWRLPRPLVMWATVRLIAHATQWQWSSQEVPALTAMDALNRWG